MTKKEYYTIDLLICKQRPYLEPLLNADILIKYDNECYANIRHLGFGATDSSKLLDINPFNSRQDLLEEKQNMTIDNTISFKDTVRKGRDLEDLIIRKAQEHLGIQIFKPKMMYNKKDTKLNVNFDGVAQYDKWLIPIECKVCSIYGQKHYDYSKSITEDVTQQHWHTTIDALKKHTIVGDYTECGYPSYYYTQLQQQEHFLAAPFGILAVLDDKTWTMHYFLSYADDAIIKEILIQEAKYRHVINNEITVMEKISKDLRDEEALELAEFKRLLAE